MWKLLSVVGAAGVAGDVGAAEAATWHALVYGCRGDRLHPGTVPGKLEQGTVAALLRSLAAAGSVRKAERVFEATLHNLFQEVSLAAAASPGMLLALSTIKGGSGGAQLDKALSRAAAEHMARAAGVTLPRPAKPASPEDGGAQAALSLGSVWAPGSDEADQAASHAAAFRDRTAASASNGGLTAAALAAAERDFMGQVFGGRSAEILRAKRERLNDFTSHQLAVECEGDISRLASMSPSTVNDIARSYGLGAAAVGLSDVTPDEACFAAMITAYGRSGDVSSARRVFDVYCAVYTGISGVKGSSPDAHPLRRILTAARDASSTGSGVSITVPPDAPGPSALTYTALLGALASDSSLGDQDPEALLDVAAGTVRRMTEGGVPVSAENYAALITLHGAAGQLQAAEELLSLAQATPATMHHYKVHTALIALAAQPDLVGGEVDYRAILRQLSAPDAVPLQGDCGTYAATIAAHSVAGTLGEVEGTVDDLLCARVTPSNEVYTQLLHTLHGQGHFAAGVSILDKLASSDPGLVHRWGTHIGVSIVQLYAAGASTGVVQLKAEDVVVMWQAMCAPPHAPPSLGSAPSPVRRPLMPPRAWQVDGVGEFVVHLSCALNAVVQRLAGSGRLRAAVSMLRLWTVTPEMPFGKITTWLWSSEDAEASSPVVDWSPTNLKAWGDHALWLRDSVGVVFEWLERSLAVLSIATGAAGQVSNSVYLFEAALRLRARGESAVLWRTGAGATAGAASASPDAPQAAGRRRPSDSFARRRTMSGFDHLASLWAPEAFPSTGGTVPFGRAPPRVPTVGALLRGMGLVAWGESALEEGEDEGWCVESDALPWHALMHAYMLAGRAAAALGVLPLLKERGVVPPPSMLVTALHTAVSSGQPEVCEDLVQQTVAIARVACDKRMTRGHGVPPAEDYALLLEWCPPVLISRLRGLAAAGRTQRLLEVWDEYTGRVLPQVGLAPSQIITDAFVHGLADVMPYLQPCLSLMPDVASAFMTTVTGSLPTGTPLARILAEGRSDALLTAGGLAPRPADLLTHARRAVIALLASTRTPTVSSLTSLSLVLFRAGCSTDARILLRTLMRHAVGETYSAVDALDDVAVSHRREDANASMRCALPVPPPQGAPAVDSLTGTMHLKDTAGVADSGEFLTTSVFDTPTVRHVLSRAAEGSAATLAEGNPAEVAELMLALGEAGCVPEVCGLVQYLLNQDLPVSVENGLAVAALAALAAAGDATQSESLWRDHRVDFSLIAERQHSLMAGIRGGLLHFVWQLAAAEVSPEAFAGDQEVTLAAVASIRLLSLVNRGHVHAAVMGLEACALSLAIPLWREAITAVISATTSLPRHALLLGARHERNVGAMLVQRDVVGGDGELPASPDSGSLPSMSLPAPAAAGLVCRLEHAAHALVRAGIWRPRAVDVNLLIMLYGILGETGTAQALTWALFDSTASRKPGAKAAQPLGGALREKACTQAAAVALATAWTDKRVTSAASTALELAERLTVPGAGAEAGTSASATQSVESAGGADSTEPWRILRCWGVTEPAAVAAARSDALPSAARAPTGVVAGDPASRVALHVTGAASNVTLIASMFALAVAPAAAYTRGVASRQAKRALEAAAATLGLSTYLAHFAALGDIIERRQASNQGKAGKAPPHGTPAAGTALSSPQDVMLACVSALLAPSGAGAAGAALERQEVGVGAGLAQWLASLSAAYTTVPVWGAWRLQERETPLPAQATHLLLSSLGVAVGSAMPGTAPSNISHHIPRAPRDQDQLRTTTLRLSRCLPVLDEAASPAQLSYALLERMHKEAGQVEGELASAVAGQRASLRGAFSVEAEVQAAPGAATATGGGATALITALGEEEEAAQTQARVAALGPSRSPSPVEEREEGAHGAGLSKRRFRTFDRTPFAPPSVSGSPGGVPDAPTDSTDLLVRSVTATDVHELEASVMTTQLELDTLTARLAACD
ncbi:unnamed protein product, partial [Symbiodinium sp. KB8]